MTQRGQLSARDTMRLQMAQSDAVELRERFQELAVEMVRKSSYREVSRLTGLSTNTLQRWVKEADE